MRSQLPFYGPIAHMFSGEYEHSIDDKGRLIIPAKLRSELPDEVFITRGLDRCLFVYPPEAWQKVADKLKQLPITLPQTRHLHRLFFAGTESTLDKQGRISIPPSLREHAGIELGGEVVVVGIDSRIELWNKARWKEITELLSSDLTDVTAQLGELAF